VDTLAFANFSTALHAARADALVGAKEVASARQPASHPGYRSVVLDYGKQVGASQPSVLHASQQPRVETYGAPQALSVDDARRERVGKQLARVGAALEEAFGGPQDVEGALTGDELYIVQTRPQP
jgi:phosphoglucan,water dikinase